MDISVFDTRLLNLQTPELDAMTVKRALEIELEPIEKASIDELRNLQLSRLKWSLNHAYQNSPLYRKKFDLAGIRPADLQSLDDLARFPLTAKTTCGSSIHSALLRPRWRMWCESMHPVAQPANRRYVGYTRE